jgi:hypothetical protein
MAKSFEERCQAAMRPSSRSPDVKTVLADLENLLDELNAEANAQRLRSLDPDIASQDARTAKAKADDATFEAERLQALKPRLLGRLQQIEERDRARQEDEERRRLVEETSALAAKLSERWPALTGELITLFAETEANAKAVEAYNRNQPKHALILCAEFQARGVAGPFWPNLGGHVDRLFAMRIPGFTSPRDEWPIDHHRAEMAKMQAVQHAEIVAARERNTPAALAEAKRREEARWTRYTVRQARYCGTRIPVQHREGKAGIGNEPSVNLWMNEFQAAAARELGLELKAAPMEQSKPVKEAAE